MPRVVYTNEDGFKEIREVPNNLSPSDYYMGILIGPPDLSSVTKNKMKLRLLNNALVDAKLIQWPDLAGQRHKLTEIVSRLWQKTEDRRHIKYKILVIYQRDYLW
jgi:hypothetical protein